MPQILIFPAFSNGLTQLTNFKFLDLVLVIKPY